MSRLMKNNDYLCLMNSKQYDEIRQLITDDILEYAFPGFLEASCDRLSNVVFCEDYADFLEEAVQMNDELDPSTLEIIKALDRIKEQYHVTDGDLERILGYTLKLSHLRITHSGKIFLDDYDGIEVRMDSLCKAVYFLFLSHPEGIDYKSLPDYRDELGAFYYRYSGKDRSEDTEKSLDMLCNTIESNSINEKASRIKKAFVNVVEDRIAKNYYITGKAGELKRIELEGSLIDWER